MVDRMRDELHHVVLNLGNFEAQTMPHVKEESERAGIQKTIADLKAECVNALHMINDIHHIDEEGKVGLKSGVQAIKRKAAKILFPVQSGEHVAFYYGERRVQ